MNIISSLPVIRHAPKALVGNSPGTENAQPPLQNEGKNESIVAPLDSKPLQSYRSERVDLRSLEVKTENLIQKRALNAYQVTSEILATENDPALARLDLFA